jgi:hypothetical protein
MARLAEVERELTLDRDPRNSRGIHKLRDFHGEQVAERAWIACTAPLPHGVAPGVEAVPGWQVWELD